MVIRHGASRSVILVGKLAFKFPRFHSWKSFLMGLLGNMQEREFSNTGWPELCPVIFSLPGGFLVVMPRVKTLTDDEWVEFQADDKIVHFIEHGDYRIPSEWKQDSYGWYKGNIVAVDYG